MAADKVSAAALGIRFTPDGQAEPGTCLRLDPRAAATFAVPPQGIALTASGPGTQVSLRRYASESFPVALGMLAPGAAEQLRIPSDRSPRSWSLQLNGGPRVTACRERGP